MSRKCPTCRLTTGKKEWCLQHDKCKACCGCWRNYMARNYMAVDQYGRTFHNLGPHPRKVLMERVGCKHATRMYVTREGKTFHIGWVIAGLWLTVYEVVPMEVEVR